MCAMKVRRGWRDADVRRRMDVKCLVENNTVWCGKKFLDETHFFPHQTVLFSTGHLTSILLLKSASPLPLLTFMAHIIPDTYSSIHRITFNLHIFYSFSIILSLFFLLLSFLFHYTFTTFLLLDYFLSFFQCLKSSC